MELHTCAVTGHRPTRFKWKYNENNNGYKRLKKRMHDQFIVLYEKGVRRFLVGGGLGVDQWAGEIILRLKEQPEDSDIELVVVLPFPGHDEQWDTRSREWLAFLIRHSAECITVGKGAGRENYVQRNCYMADHADCLLAVYDGERNPRSGTMQTVNYASSKMPIVLIHPDTAAVSFSGQMMGVR